MGETFKDWLVALLKDRDLTYEQLGDLIGVSHGAVGGWVRGKYTPDPPALIQLARVAHADPSRLFHMVYGLPLPEDADELDERIRRIVKRAEQLSDDELRRLEDYIDYVAMPRVRRDNDDARKPEASEAKTGKTGE